MNALNFSQKLNVLEGCTLFQNDLPHLRIQSAAFHWILNQNLSSPRFKMNFFGLSFLKISSRYLSNLHMSHLMTREPN